MESFPTPAKAAEAMWVNASSETRCTFDRDCAGSGKCVCNGVGAARWLLLVCCADPRAQGDRSVITRDDGGRQGSCERKPPRAWIKDHSPGTKTGDGVNNDWRVAPV